MNQIDPVIDQLEEQGFKLESKTKRSVLLVRDINSDLLQMVELISNELGTRIAEGVCFKFIRGNLAKEERYFAYHISLGVLTQINEFKNKLKSKHVDARTILHDLKVYQSVIDKYFSTSERIIGSFLSGDFHPAVFNRESGFYTIGLLAFLNGKENIGRNLFNQFLSFDLSNTRNVERGKLIKDFLTKEDIKPEDVKQFIVKEYLEQRKLDPK